MQTLELWRKVWRNGIAPCLNPRALTALRDALRDDDPRLIQGATTDPPGLPAVYSWPVKAACAIGYCGWKGEQLETVSEVTEYFSVLCFDADQRLGEPAAIRWFLNFWDETPREEMRRSFLAEVDRTLRLRVDTALESK